MRTFDRYRQRKHINNFCAAIGFAFLIAISVINLIVSLIFF